MIATFSGVFPSESCEFTLFLFTMISSRFSLDLSAIVRGVSPSVFFVLMSAPLSA